MDSFGLTWQGMSRVNAFIKLKYKVCCHLYHNHKHVDVNYPSFIGVMGPKQNRMGHKKSHSLHHWYWISGALLCVCFEAAPLLFASIFGHSCIWNRSTLVNDLVKEISVKLGMIDQKVGTMQVRQEITLYHP